MAVAAWGSFWRRLCAFGKRPSTSFLRQASFDRLPSTGFLRQAQENGLGWGGGFYRRRSGCAGLVVFIDTVRAELVEVRTERRRKRCGASSASALRQASFDRLRRTGWAGVVVLSTPFGLRSSKSGPNGGRGIAGRVRQVPFDRLRVNGLRGEFSVPFAPLAPFGLSLSKSARFGRRAGSCF